MVAAETLDSHAVTQGSNLPDARPMIPSALEDLAQACDVDLTYTSNAIEGNTLTLRERAELIEHGITVGGKPLRDHLEAVDHYNSGLWMRELAAKTTPLDESIVRELSPPHSQFSGCVSERNENPGLMKEYGEWLANTDPEPAPALTR
jgi:Fic family protein